MTKLWHFQIEGSFAPNHQRLEFCSKNDIKGSFGDVQPARYDGVVYHVPTTYKGSLPSGPDDILKE